MKQRDQMIRRFSGFLDSGTSFTGDLRFEGTVRIDGVLEGSVSTPDVLIVGPDAIIRANVHAGTAQVHGRIEGNVCCTRRLELCSEGRIDGDIETPHLVIEEGAIFDGRSHMTGSHQPASDIAAKPRDPVEADAAPIVPSSADDAAEQDTSPSLESQPTRWRNLVRHFETTALRNLSTSPSDSE